MMSTICTEEILAYHAAPCLAGIKPANLISFPSSLGDLCTTYNRLLNTYDIFLCQLCTCKARQQIFIYRKSLLTEYFFQEDVYDALHFFGFNPEKGIDSCIALLKAKMVSQLHFPHEIGLFLGYPVQDVFAYMKTGGQACLFCGYWKVYSEPERARKLFHQYTECKERFALQIKSGMSIAEIINAA
ncbi:MAG: DUF3793 family protein [Treponema sp.]